MKIGVVFVPSESWVGGQNYVINLLRCLLLKHAARNVRLYSFCEEKTWFHTEVEALGVTIVDTQLLCPVNRMRRLLVALTVGRQPALEKRLAGDHIDTILAIGEFMGRSTRFQVTYWIPDMQHFRMPHMFGPIRRLLRDIQYRLFLKVRAVTMVSSRAVQEDLVAAYGRKVLEKTVIVPFAKIEAIESNREALKKILADVGVKSPFLFVPNQLWKHKNHAVIVKAAALQKSADPLPIYMTGSIEDPRHPMAYHEFKADVQRAGLEDRVVHLGAVKWAVVETLMQSCLGVINPSFFEGRSTTVEEAKAYGKSIILSSIPVHAEQVRGYPVAQLFDPNDPVALARILDKVAECRFVSGETKKGWHEKWRVQEIAEFRIGLERALGCVTIDS